MAAKGTIAKDRVAKALAQAFGNDYLGCVDKKSYVLADDGGEKIQVAVSLTCPKTPVEFGNTVLYTGTGNELNFEDMVAVPAATPAPEVSEAEQANIKSLLEKLGL